MSKINKSWVDSTVLTEDSYDIASGTPQLDGSGKIKASQLPADVVEYKGAWDASTNSPTLADGTGAKGDQYRVSVDGSQDLGSGTIAFYTGDLIIHNGSIYERIPESSSFAGKDTDDLSEGSVNFYYTEGRFDTSLAAKDSDDISEGSTNKYFTEVRVEDTVLANYVVGADSAVASTDDVKGAIGKLQGQLDASPAGETAQQELITLTGTDISNGYYDLALSPASGIVIVTPDGAPTQMVGDDYSVSTNRVTFLGDMATELIIGDKVLFTYSA